MYKAILFDLDGTLLDTSSGVIEAVKRTIARLNLSALSDEAVQQFVGPPMQQSFQKFYDFGPDRALEAANLFRTNYQKYSLFKAELYDGVIDMLEKLKSLDIKMAVATNKSHDNAVLITEYFGISRYCGFIMGSDLEGKLTKADIMEKCLAELNAEKNETVMIGDSEFDLAGAQATKIDFIAVTYGFGFKNKTELGKYNPVFVVTKPSDLTDYFYR